LFGKPKETQDTFMKILFYQVIVVGVASVMLFTGIKDFVKRETGQTFLKLSVRLIVWGGMALVAIFPEFTRLFAKILGIEGNINAVILTGFLLIFLLIFKLLSAIEKLEQNLSELTRKDTLKQLSGQKKKLNSP
jgi:hypothetical protein